MIELASGQVNVLIAAGSTGVSERLQRTGPADRSGRAVPTPAGCTGGRHYSTLLNYNRL